MKATSSVIMAYVLYCTACDEPAYGDAADGAVDDPWSAPNRVAVLFRNEGYDCAPAVIQEGDVRHFWWCGRGETAGDDIYYRSYDFTSRTYSPIVQVLTASPGRWDGLHTCDPSVVAGRFTNPEDDEVYAYAMYYGATDVPETGNRIGVAFSNDKVGWVKLSTPIVYPTDPSDPSYGVGQPAAINADGSSRIYLFHTDTTASPPGVRLRIAEDGIHFGRYVDIATRGGVPFHANSDFVWDRPGRRFHSAAPYAARPGDREAYAIGLYSISEDDLTDPRKTWRLDGIIDTNVTGYYLNHSPSLLRDGFGQVDGSSRTVEVYFGAGDDDPSTWDLTLAREPSTPATLALARYYDPNSRHHWVTTGYVASGYVLESVPGYLFRTERPGTMAIYSCRAGSSMDSDHFISLRADCVGRVVLGTNGWAYATPPVGIETRPIYQCATGRDHFVSRRSDCEGWTAENEGRPLFHALTALR